MNYKLPDVYYYIVRNGMLPLLVVADNMTEDFILHIALRYGDCPT